MEQLVLSIDDAAKVLSVGKSKIYQEIKAGRLAAFKLGRRTFIKRESIEEYLANLECYPVKMEAYPMLSPYKLLICV